HLSARVAFYDGKLPIFEHYGLEDAIKRIFHNRHGLQSGGSLVIDFTEALTVIDVNTGKFTGKDNLEQTILQTNLEAARTLARLLRLRDIGGIIIVDFIDMASDEHRELVLQTLKEAVLADRTKTVIVGWTALGLLEMTRKKVRRNDEGIPGDTQAL